MEELTTSMFRPYVNIIGFKNTKKLAVKNETCFLNYKIMLLQRGVNEVTSAPVELVFKLSLHTIFTVTYMYMYGFEKNSHRNIFRRVGKKLQKLLLQSTVYLHSYP